MTKKINYLLSLIFALSLNALAAPNSIIAIVNDDLITLDAISENIKPSFTKKQKIQLLNQKIDLTLQLQEIKKIGIAPTTKSLDATLRNFASQKNLTFEQLKAHSQFDEINNDFIDILSLRGLRQIISKKENTQLTDSEIETELSKTKKLNGSSTLKKQVKIAQIAIESIDQTDLLLLSKDALIKQFLTGLSSKINKGESFSSLAKLHSQDPSYKDGGKSDWLMVDSLPLIFKKEIDKLSKGVLSKPFKVGKGWRIIKIIDTRKIDTRIRIIKAKLIKAKQNTYFKNWVQSLRKDAYIEVFDHKL